MPQFQNNRINQLFQIQYPIIQAGMIWCSGWKLASAVSNQGGLGIIGAGSMYPDVLREHLTKCKSVTNKPFAVNLPLLYPDIEAHIQSIIEFNVPIVFTSAGNPGTWTPHLKEQGITVVHVVPNVKLAIKCQEKGVDAVVCEGFEAGGHNGKDEITSMVLIPQVVDALEIPVIAAGGIGDGRAIVSAMALGADGVQIGSRFAATQESSAHENFKNAIVKASDSDTMLMMKKVVPVRLLKNKFFDEVHSLESENADPNKLRELLGKGRAKRGMFEGELDEGELEIGQISGLIKDVPTVEELFQRLLGEIDSTLHRLSQFS